MSSSSSRAVSMMIGTVLRARSCLQTSSPSSFGSIRSRTTRSTGCSPKRCERLLAVGRLNHAVAVALEREAEHLADGLVVVDEQNRRGIVHWVSPVSRAYRAHCPASWRFPLPTIALDGGPHALRSGAAGGLAAARSRGRSTAGSTAPRSSSSLVSRARCSRSRSHGPMPLAKPALPGSFDTASALALAQRPDDAVPGPRARKRRRDRARRTGSSTSCRRSSTASADATSSWTQDVPGLGRVRLRNIVGGGAGPVAGRDRRHGPPGRHRDGPGRERQRERHGRADRARPRRTPSRDERAGARRLAAHDRLPLDRRRRLRRARRRALPRDLAVRGQRSSP